VAGLAEFEGLTVSSHAFHDAGNLTLCCACSSTLVLSVRQVIPEDSPLLTVPR